MTKEAFYQWNIYQKAAEYLDAFLGREASMAEIMKFIEDSRYRYEDNESERLKGN